jgi:uncharacterized protein DUF3313
MRQITQALLVAGGLTLLYTFAVHGKPRVETGPDAEVTHDGLYRVDRSTMDSAWVKPDLDLRPYQKIMLKGVEMSFRAVDADGEFYRPGLDDQTEFAIDADARQMLAEVFAEAFREQLAMSKRYEIVTQAGPRTLLLIGTLIDIVSHVPPDNAPGRNDVYLSSVGEATLVLELRDAVTNEVLARAADRRAAEQAGYAPPANSVTSWAEVRRLATSWASLLRKRLDEITVVAG